MIPWNKYLLRNYLICSTWLSSKRECHHSIHCLPLGSDSCLLWRLSQSQQSSWWDTGSTAGVAVPAAHLHWVQTWINHTIALVPSEPAHSASPPLNSAGLKRPSAGLCLSSSINIECKAAPCSLPHRLTLLQSLCCDGSAWECCNMK